MGVEWLSVGAADHSDADVEARRIEATVTWVRAAPTRSCSGSETRQRDDVACPKWHGFGDLLFLVIGSGLINGRPVGS
jgi:hypothetical protein